MCAENFSNRTLDPRVEYTVDTTTWGHHTKPIPGPLAPSDYSASHGQDFSVMYSSVRKVSTTAPRASLLGARQLYGPNLLEIAGALLDHGLWLV